MILRNAHSGYAKVKSACALDCHFDIDYIWHKCPYARQSDSSDEWLIERLGKANSRRREYFKYCEEHHKKLSHVPPEQKEQETDKEIHITLKDSPLTPPEAFSRPPSTFTPTTASTYVENIPEENAEGGFEVESATTIATSLGDQVEGNLCIPPRPKGALDGKPFECPFCFTIQMAKNEHSWR